jgi:hypothetical protein
MPILLRIAFGLLAVLLGAWAVALFLIRPSFTILTDTAVSAGPDERVRVACDSVFGAGWERSRELQTPSSPGSRSYRVEEGLELLDRARPTPGQRQLYGSLPSVEAQIDANCGQRRTAYAALMALVLAPATAFAVLTVVPARRPLEGAPDGG